MILDSARKIGKKRKATVRVNKTLSGILNFCKLASSCPDGTFDNPDAIIKVGNVLKQ